MKANKHILPILSFHDKLTVPSISIQRPKQKKEHVSFLLGATLIVLKITSVNSSNALATTIIDEPYTLINIQWVASIQINLVHLSNEIATKNLMI